MDPFITDNGMESTKKDMAYHAGKMDPSMKDSGQTIKLMGEANFTTWMATHTKASGWTTEPTAMASILIQTVTLTKAHG